MILLNYNVFFDILYHKQTINLISLQYTESLTLNNDIKRVYTHFTEPSAACHAERIELGKCFLFPFPLLDFSPGLRRFREIWFAIATTQTAL